MKVPDRKTNKGNSCLDDDPDATELDAEIIDGYTAGRLLARCHSKAEREATAAQIVEAVATRERPRRQRPGSSVKAC
jgi:hypothetical protein